MLEVIFVRHGESTGNQENRWQGTADFPLSERGVWEARRTAERLVRHAPDAIYSSPLGRARQTAEFIAAATGCTPVLDDRLQEYDVGELAGLSVDEIRERYPAVHEAMMRPGAAFVPMPGEEGALPFRARIVAIWDDIVAAHPVGRVLVVSHRAVIMGIMSHLVGFAPGHRSPFRFYNCSISTVEVRSGRTCIRQLNDTCHLRGRRKKLHAART